MEDKITITEQSFQRLEEKETEQVTGYRHSVWKEIRKEFLSNKAALFSMVFLSVILIAVLLAPLSPYDPYEIDISQKMQGMSASHIFGTDDYGRDYLTRALYGGRVSLLVGFCSMFITVIIGTTIGVFSGYIGGKLDMILMRFTDIFLALPSMLLMIVLNAILQPGLVTLIFVLSLFSWAQVARITRAETMSVKERDYVIATKNLGAGSLRIAFNHIIPNILGPVVVAASLGVASAILMESSLSFLGLGVQQYASKCSGAYSGHTKTCNSARSADHADCLKFQSSGRRTENGSGTQDREIGGKRNGHIIKSTGS